MGGISMTHTLSLADGRPGFLSFLFMGGWRVAFGIELMHRYPFCGRRFLLSRCRPFNLNIQLELVSFVQI